jgi:hypothetical protein
MATRRFKSPTMKFGIPLVVPGSRYVELLGRLPAWPTRRARASASPPRFQHSHGNTWKIFGVRFPPQPCTQTYTVSPPLSKSGATLHERHFDDVPTL